MILIVSNHAPRAEIFPRRSDGRHARFGLVNFPFNRILRFMGIFSPYLCGVPQLGLSFADPQVDRLLGLSRYDEAVIS